jgi:cytolysin (calcineurin-like family phosphatase)
MEGAKLVTAGWLAQRWRVTAPVWRLALAALIAGLAVINATGVYAQLVAAHVGERGPVTSAIEMRDAALAARLEVAARTVADLDRRLGQIDLTIEEAAKRGRTTTAFTAIEAARKTREVLEAQRQREGKTLADLKAERAALGAKGRQIETEDAPIRYVAELLGAEADSERAIR